MSDGKERKSLKTEKDNGGWGGGGANMVDRCHESCSKRFVISYVGEIHSLVSSLCAHVRETEAARALTFILPAERK